MGNPYFLLPAAPNGSDPEPSINSNFNCTNFRRTMATCKSLKCWCTLSDALSIKNKSLEPKATSYS